MRAVVAIFAAAVLFNYPWEVAQSMLFADQPPFPTRLWHCFVASLGDAVLVLLIWTTGVAVFRSGGWFQPPGWRRYGLMLLIGVVVGVVVEATALSLGRWSYTMRMPRIGSVGVIPVLQMVIVPPLVFAAVTRIDIGRGGEAWRLRNPRDGG